MDIIKNKIIFSILLIFIFSISLISAEQENPTFTLNNEVDLKLTCTVNGSVCSAAAECNITIKYPNETTLIDSESMTNNDNGIFNITINESLLSLVSNYNWDLFCCDGTECGEGHGTFVVTPTGIQFDEGQGLIVVGIIIILSLVALSLLYFSLKIEYIPFRIFLTALGFLFLMFTVGIGVNIINELMISGAVLSSSIINLYRLMLILVSAGGIGLMLYIITMSVRQFYSYRGLIDEE